MIMDVKRLIIREIVDEKIDSVPKHFDLAAEEEKIYKEWMEAGAFRAEAPSTKRPFTIMMPRPYHRRTTYGPCS